MLRSADSESENRAAAVEIGVGARASNLNRMLRACPMRTTARRGEQPPR